MGVQINGSEGNVIATKGTYSGNVTIGGTLTYEDVTNIDSVGLVTARNGIEIGARPGVAASISVDGNMVVSGITTIGNSSGGNEKLNVHGAIRSSTSSANFNAGLEGTLVDYDISNNTSRFGHVSGASGSARDVVFLSGGAEKLRIASSGNVGLKTSAPAHALDIQGSSASFTKIALSNQTMNTSKYEIVFGDAGQVNHIVPASREFTIATGGTTERFRIQANGDTNVGSALSTSGLRYFDVSNTSNAAGSHGAIMRLITSNAAATGTTSVDMVKYKDGNFYISNNESSGSTNFNTGGSTRMTIASTGYITAPQQPYAMLGITANQAVTQASTKEVIFDSVMYDTASAYNSSNGRYVVPVTGDYLVTFDCQYTGHVVAFHLGVGINGTSPGTNFDVWNHTGDNVRGDNIARVIRVTANGSNYISFFTYTNSSGANLEPNRTKATIKFLG